MLMNRSLFPTLALMAIGLTTAPAQSTLFWGGGTTNLADGTALPTTHAGMTGDWTAALENWSNAVSPTVYDAWIDGSIANLGYTVGLGTGTITPNFSMTLGGLVLNTVATGGNNQNITLNPSSAQTLTLSGSSALFLIHAQNTTSINGLILGGNLSLGASTTALVKDGTGHLTLNGGNSNAFTGPVIVRSGNFIVNSNSSINGVTQFTLAGYRTPPLPAVPPPMIGLPRICASAWPTPPATKSPTMPSLPCPAGNCSSPARGLPAPKPSDAFSSNPSAFSLPPAVRRV